MTKKTWNLSYLAIISIVLSAFNGYNASYSHSLSFSVGKALEAFALCALAVCVFLLTEQLKVKFKNSEGKEIKIALCDGAWIAGLMIWGYFFSKIAYTVGGAEPEPLTLWPYIWIAIITVLAVTGASYLIRKNATR